MVVIGIRAMIILLLFVLGLLCTAAIAHPSGNVSPGHDCLSPGHACTYCYGYPSHYWYPVSYYPADYCYYSYPSSYYPYNYYYSYPSRYYTYGYYYPYTYGNYWHPNIYYSNYWWYW